MDCKMSVPVLSIVFMAISAILAIGVPVCLFIVFRKKFSLKIVPMLAGIAGFVVFALVLEAMVHRIVIGRFIQTSDRVLYIIYGACMAGLFEETARFIAFKILKRKYDGIGTALSYGIGHGGIEAILLAGLAMISSIVTSIIINTGNIESITGSLQGDALAAANYQITTIITTAPYMFLVGGFERVFAIAVHISLSVVVFYSVFGKNKLWLYPLAILLHAIVDITAMLFQTGVLKSIFVVEVIVCVFAVCLAFFAKYLHGKLSSAPMADLSPSISQ
jgi:uncharacterized membrane protein YhfC